MNKFLIIGVFCILVVSCANNDILQKSDLLISNCTNKQIISKVISNESSVYKDTLQKQTTKKIYEHVRYAYAPYPDNVNYDLIWLYNCIDSTYCLMSNYNLDNNT